jgi:hypothetical protein
MLRAVTDFAGRYGAALLLQLALAACRSTDTAMPAESRVPQEPSIHEPTPAPSAPPEFAPDSSWTVLCDGTSLGRFEPTSFGGEGAVDVTSDGVRLGLGMMLTGIRLSELGDVPRDDYELEVVAARLLGTDFFCGLTFPVRDGCATLICGGWGGALTGLSCLDGLDASDNETKTYRRYEKGRDYTIRVRVADGRVRAWIDGESVLDVSIEGRRVHLRTEVLKSAPLGISSYATTARIRSVRFRTWPLPRRRKGVASRLHCLRSSGGLRGRAGARPRAGVTTGD